MKTVVSGVRLPPEWLPTSSTGPSSGTLPRPRTSPRNHSAREQPQARERLADVVGVALVEVGGRDAAADEAPEGAEEPPVRSGAPRGRVGVAVAVAGRGRGHRRSPTPVTPLAGGTRRAGRRARRSAPAGRSCAPGASTCGHVAAALEHDLLGARQPALDVVAEAAPGSAGRARPRRTARAARSVGEPRVEAVAAERRLEVDRAGAGRGTPAARRASGRCARTRRRRCRRRSGPRGRGRRTAPRTCARCGRRPSECGSIPSSGRAKRTSQCQSRRTKATAGLSSAIPPTRSGRSRPTSIATRPPMLLPTRWARSMPERVHRPDHRAWRRTAAP